jgi:hypothetical protein
LDARINFDSGKVFVDLGLPRKARVELARQQLGMQSLSELLRRFIDEGCDRAGVPRGDPAGQRSGPLLPAA